MVERTPAGDPGRTLRTFIGVEVPEGERAAIAALIGSVAGPEARGQVRWVRPEGLHLTLRFLGRTPVEAVPVVAEVVRAVGRGSAPFELEIAGAGAFPSARRPRVLWLAVRRGGEVLAELAAALDRGLEPLGWLPEERPYAAHLTLARTEPGPGAAAVAAALVAAAARLHLVWRVEELVLFESQLARGGARYVALERFRLGSDGGA